MFNQPNEYQRGLIWFRRDLRASDHAALRMACERCQTVYGVFVFDDQLLSPLPRQDRRLEFIVHALDALDQDLADKIWCDSPVVYRAYGNPVTIIPHLAKAWGIQAVFANQDDEPQAIVRDRSVSQSLADLGIECFFLKDHCFFARGEVVSSQGTPYTVFTPYQKKWLATLMACPEVMEPHIPNLSHMRSWVGCPNVSAFPYIGRHVRELGFEPTNLLALGIEPSYSGASRLLDQFRHRIAQYAEQRDFPAIKGPSYLSVHLRFGTISIRQLVRLAAPLVFAGNKGATVWLSELIWRDFYFQILFHFPRVVDAPFRPAYEMIQWREDSNSHRDFEAWAAGQTGYPLVDAGMQQLLQTGYMHNRLRMVTASFLTKHLGIDYRRGEAHFAKHLIDFDLAANNGGWQWSASTGCDAQPYFRIFNPVTQSQKFDPMGKFIRRYVPALAPLTDKEIHTPWLFAAGRNIEKYPPPIVDHHEARKATLARFAVVKGDGSPL